MDDGFEQFECVYGFGPQELTWAWWLHGSAAGRKYQAARLLNAVCQAGLLPK